MGAYDDNHREDASPREELASALKRLAVMAEDEEDEVNREALEEIYDQLLDLGPLAVVY